MDQAEKAFGQGPWVAITSSILRRTGHCSKGSTKFYILFKGLRFFSGYILLITPAAKTIKIKAAITMAAKAVTPIFNNINIHTSLKNGVIPLFYWPAAYFVDFRHPN
jgi:hypothetical protein